MLKRLAAFLKLDPKVALATAARSSEKFKAGELGQERSFDTTAAYRRIVSYFRSGGPVDELAEQILTGLRMLFRISANLHEQLMNDPDLPNAWSRAMTPVDLVALGLQPPPDRPAEPARMPAPPLPPVPARAAAPVEPEAAALADWCAAGEKADAAYAAGKFREASLAYQATFDWMLATRKVDLFVAGKVVLGLLLCHLKLGETQQAFTLWTAPKDSPLWFGIQGLEQGQVSARDAIVYKMIEGFLHSLSLGDKQQAANAVNKIMSTVSDYSFEHEPDWLPQVLSNWHRHLAEVYENGSPPEAVAAGLQRAVKRSGHELPLCAIDFPQPARWVIDWLPEGQAAAGASGVQPAAGGPAAVAGAVRTGESSSARCERCGQEFTTARLLSIHSKRCK